jgi:hypothetical protein
VVLFQPLNVTVNATYVSSTAYTCLTPPSSAPGPATIDLSQNAQQFTGSPVSFTFYSTLYL